MTPPCLRAKSALAIISVIVASLCPATAQTTAFTYQGHLVDSGSPANGVYALQFSVYDASTNGTLLGGTLTITNNPVTNGLLTATLDFGGGVFTGPDRWLQIGVRPDGSTNAFAVLLPRQALTPTPYAIYAALAGGVPNGTISSTQLTANAVSPINVQSNAITSSKIAPGQVVKSLNGLRDDVVVVPGPGLSLNTSGNVLQLSADVGSYWNVNGNGGTTSNQFLGTTDNKPLEFRVNNIRALRFDPNTNSPNIIGGYASNVVSSTVAGSTISGGGNSGNENTVAANFSVVGGGMHNVIQVNANGATIGGGVANTNSGSQSTIAGGGANIIQTNSGNAAIGGGYANQASADTAAIIGGNRNTASGVSSTVGGGYLNKASGPGSFIGGGNENQATNFDSAVSGGFKNKAYGETAFVGGGYLNSASGFRAAIGGGAGNSATGIYSFIGAGDSNTAHNNSFIGAGYLNVADLNSVIGGGNENVATNTWCVVGGGFKNKAVGYASVILGGINNTATAQNAVVAGGESNTAGGQYATSSGGVGNTASGFSSTVSGGNQNSAGGQFSAVPGGYNNVATNDFSFAAGRRAKANHQGAFVWGDSTDADVASTTNNQFAVRASGGVVFYSDPAATSGVYLPPGGGAFSSLSDRNSKANLEPVDGRSVLDRLAAMPIATWNYKSQQDSIRHMGPMAQDFAAAFGVGEDARRINTVDADGVALAAIQGLNQKVEALSGEIKRRNAENAELKLRLERLEQWISRTNGGEK